MAIQPQSPLMEKKKNSIDKFWQVSSLEIPILPEKKAEANNVNLEVILALRKKVTIECCSINCLRTLIIVMGKLSVINTVIFYKVFE